MKRTRRCLTVLLGWAALVLLVAGGARAQGVTTAAVRGTVTSNGQPAANIQVVVRHTGTGATRGAITNAAGQYYVPNLLPGGPYTVSASGLGLTGGERTGLQLVLSQTTTVDFDLSQAAIALEGLTVTAENNAVISRSRTGAATVVSDEVLEATPTLSRNFTEVARLSPHVTGSSETPSVGGANNRFNNIQIDGATASDIFGLGSSGTPGGQGSAAKPIPLDAIDQFQVLVTPFDVRQAGFTGGLINAVTKSGTNDFQGSGFINYRNESFVRGDTIYAFGQTNNPLREFTNRQFGATLGGPIVRDRLHFFFAGEVEQRQRPGSFGRTDESSIGLRTATLDRIAQIAEGYGIDPGSAATFTEELSLGNLFGRIDYRISDRHRLALRHNYAPKWRDDVGPSRGGSNFDFTSYNYTYKTDVNSTVAQLFSDLGDNLSNELLVNFQSIIDRPSPETRFPAIEVTVVDTVGGIAQPSRRVRMGSEFSRQYNELDQTMFQITNNLVWNLSAHRLTFGLNAEYFDFRNAFVQNWIGTYTFRSVADFAAGRVNSFTRNVPLRDNPVALFAVFQPGAYLQDEWSVTDNLSFTAGLRVDVPLMLDEPARNEAFVRVFQRDNSDVPSAKPLIQPRVGFNWQNDAELRTQIRGGVGMFAGRPPYVWLSNAFSNTGVDFAQINCTGANAPAYNAQTAQAGPATCGTGPSAGVASVNNLSPDYRFPQELKASAGLDQELPFGFTGTFEFVYSKGIDRTIAREINLRGAQNVPASATQGIGPRVIYGTPQNDATSAFSAARIDPAFRHTVELDRLTAGDAYTVVAELARSFGDNIDVRGAYTWNRSRDPGSFGSSTATSNVGLHPIGQTVNDFSLAPSSFERPHKVTLYGVGRLPQRFGGAELSAVYIGQSGRNYYYIYNGDVNGDGYPGAGVTNRYNDLLYVPNSIDEIAFTSPDDRRLFQELIDMEECLQNARGTIMQRYSCRAPFTSRLDARITQPVSFRGNRLQVEVNIFNLPNLLNEEWGLQQGISFSDAFALDFDNRVSTTDPTSAPRFRYAGRTRRDANNVAHAEKPYTTFDDSRYQVQLGLRFSF